MSVASIIKDIAIGAGLAVPTGAGAMYLKHKLDPPGVLTFPETTAVMPLLASSGPKAEQAESRERADLDTLMNPSNTQVGQRVKLWLTKPTEEAGSEKEASAAVASGPTIAHVLGGALGIGAGYKGLEYYLDSRRKSEIGSVIAQRRKTLADMLMAEQGLAKRSSALILDEPIAPIVGTIAGWYDKMPPNARLMFGLSALSGLGYGAVNAYRRAKASDPNRALKKALKASLAERLGDSEARGKLPRGPMVVKVEGDRIGVNPVNPGASALVDPSSGRDIFGY